MKDDHKVWHAGHPSKEELEEIDRCNLCKIMPELENTCYATLYCHRQMQMQLDLMKGEEHGTER